MDIHAGGCWVLRSRQVWCEGGLRPLEIQVAQGRIEAVREWGGGPALPAPAVLDLGERWVLPGMIDTQVHFREPGFPDKEDLESGSRAAVAGGMTAFLEMPNTRPLTTTAETLADKVARATDRCWCDFGFFMGASRENLEQLAELERLPGCCGVKIFMGSSTGSLLLPDDASLRRALANGRSRVSVHAEDEERLRELKQAHAGADHPRWHPVLRDVEAACRATARLLALAAESGRAVHLLHLNCAEEMAFLRALPPGVLGGRVTAEVTPQHLLLAAPACYEELGSRAQMNPPIRAEEHRAALWQAFLDGVIQVLGSDHAPHTARQKAGAYPATPSGMPGTETMLPLLVDQVLAGRLPLARVVAALAEEPARAFGIEGKGVIAPGARADLTVVDPLTEWTVDEATLQSRCGWSPFHGRRLRGRVSHTIIRGRLVYAEGALRGPPQGRALAFAHST
jgi:dihydroorotase